VFVPIQRIPGHLIAALLEQEDGRFRRHHGVDWSQAMHALRKDLAAGAYRYGASTITMQLVRELFLGKQRTLFRKAREIAYALQAERRLGKDEILELYLNLVHWGPSVRGVGAASCYYYGVAPADLGAGQAAELVSVLTSPERLGPELLDRIGHGTRRSRGARQTDE
jgi:membrane peptidoglycan carboxypeptidase